MLIYKNDKGICRFCDFWEPNDDPDKYGGHCHRYPPEFVSIPLKAFPRTHKNDWCGEWKKFGSWQFWILVGTVVVLAAIIVMMA